MFSQSLAVSPHRAERIAKTRLRSDRTLTLLSASCWSPKEKGKTLPARRGKPPGPPGASNNHQPNHRMGPTAPISPPPDRDSKFPRQPHTNAASDILSSDSPLRETPTSLTGKNPPSPDLMINSPPGRSNGSVGAPHRRPGVARGVGRRGARPIQAPRSG